MGKKVGERTCKFLVFNTNEEVQRTSRKDVKEETTRVLYGPRFLLAGRFSVFFCLLQDGTKGHRQRKVSSRGVEEWESEKARGSIKCESALLKGIGVGHSTAYILISQSKIF